MKDKFIIGGGISGLIFKYYNPDFTVIEAKKIKEQVNFQIGSEIRFLFKNDYTQRLLNDLKIKYELKKLRIRYYYSKLYSHSNVIPLSTLYLKRKLMDNYIHLSTVKPRQDFDARYYSINLKKVIDRLSKDIEIIENKVILIDVEEQNITLANYRKFYYEKLISTIPAHAFKHIAYNAKINNKFQYLPGTLIISDKLPQNLIKYGNKFDILYYCNDDMIFTRIWRQKFNYIYEVPKNLTLDECKKYFEEMGVPILKHDVQRIGLIFTEKINPIKNVLFLGRLANWDSDYFISTSVKEAINYKKGEQNVRKF